MIIQLKTLDDLKRWWPMFKREMSHMDPKAVKAEPSVVEQHVVNILTIPQEGWVGLNLDNEDVLGFLIMKRELSLIPQNPTYKTLLYHFAPQHRTALFDLFESFERWSQNADYIVETNYPRMFRKSDVSFDRHSITLKRNYDAPK